ncbi:hypothetical protein R5R35_004419 [Gryllus longicercus]|uniref:Uncharacterized protein n=1 Tax=Gryllus longicercus TaxID=2509291 RepID=A0AAN9V765_9ORTH
MAQLCRTRGSPHSGRSAAEMSSTIKKDQWELRAEARVAQLPETAGAGYDEAEVAATLPADEEPGEAGGSGGGEAAAALTPVTAGAGAGAMVAASAVSEGGAAGRGSACSAMHVALSAAAACLRGTVFRLCTSPAHAPAAAFGRDSSADALTAAQSTQQSGPGPSPGSSSSCEDSCKPPLRNCFRLVLLGSSRVGKTSIVAR